MVYANISLDEWTEETLPREIERERCPNCKQRVPVEAICCFCGGCMENNDGMACCACDARWEAEISGRASKFVSAGGRRQEAQPSGAILAPNLHNHR